MYYLSIEKMFLPKTKIILSHSKVQMYLKLVQARDYPQSADVRDDRFNDLNLAYSFQLIIIFGIICFHSMPHRVTTIT